MILTGTHRYCCEGYALVGRGLPPAVSHGSITSMVPVFEVEQEQPEFAGSWARGGFVIPPAGPIVSNIRTVVAMPGVFGGGAVG